MEYGYIFSREPGAEKILSLSEDRASANINSAIFVRRFRSFAFIGVNSLWCAAYQQQNPE